MLNLFLFLLLGIAVLVVAGLALRWAVRAEQRARGRHLMSRVYYPRRVRPAAPPALKRRPWWVDADEC